MVKRKFKKAIYQHEKKCIEISKSNRAIEKAQKGRHRRKFRYALKDIRECNWVLRDTSTWWQYFGSFFW